MKKGHRYALIGFYIALIVAFFVLELHQYFTFDMLKLYRSELQQYVHDHSILAAILYTCFYAIITGLSLPVGALVTLAGGLFFGSIFGTIYTTVGATIGAIIIFQLVQVTIGKPLREKAGPWLKKMSVGFQKNSFAYLLTIRLIPIFPFFAINLVPGILGMSLKSYTAATFIGIIPATYLYSLVGSGLGKVLDTDAPFSTQGILSPQIILGLTGLAILSLLPVVYKKLKSANSHRSSEQKSEDR